MNMKVLNMEVLNLNNKIELTIELTTEELFLITQSLEYIEKNNILANNIMTTKQKFISWIATSLCLIGAFMVANTIFFNGYLFFASGAILWLYIARVQKNTALFAQELVFLLANINGLFTFWNY